ncbi:hypothetical protein SARC_00745 [Sphaeroforma arctica JP610]|uniref:Uncharacterized protein n=1 Tax=Sphaeroforma arctica JP610 TaxID=667725 RepID=A0A0L0GDP3_9EUKA|nr:hypothetical protein SARC_00745 [Sphaeroforma arctica JP610]KNC87122.1 hypothetical protein SARC_00745 [Sphaeroforma arctica JP610]|eukprot:XP_014161024.1 hypothetical protein SARC_00745 [Sphaeroforma arctica JP610]
MASSLRNGLVTENKDSNLSTVHTKAIFDRFLLKAFTSEAYQQRRVLGVRGDPTAIKGISYCPPGFAVEEQSKDEVIFREGNSPLRMYYGVIEHKPQFVGFPHQVAFNIAVALDVKEASIGDKLRFLFDSWVARRYLSDAVRTTSKKDKAQFVFDSEGST